MRRMQPMQCSAATIDITPAGPVALAGRSGAARVAAQVHSPLEASALLLREADGGVALIVACDVLYIGAALRDELLARAAARGIAPGAVWLAASHTHYAAATDAAKPGLGEVDAPWLAQLLDRCAALIDRVVAAVPVPVQCEFAAVECTANVNRRRRWRWPTLTREGLRCGSTVMAPAPGMQRDTELVQIRFVDDRGCCRAVIWKYACHPVDLPLPTALSAEYPGVVRTRLRAHTGDAALPVLFLQGFAGDVRPAIAGAQDTRPRAQRVRGGPGFGTPTLAQWDQWAAGIADSAVAAWHTQRFSPLAPALRSAALSLPLRELLDGAPPQVLTLQRLQLGEAVALVGGNAEFCSPWLRWGRSGQHTVHVGYLGHVFGYLPTEQQVREGGYEAGGYFRQFDLRAARWRAGFEAHLDRQVQHLCAHG